MDGFAGSCSLNFVRGYLPSPDLEAVRDQMCRNWLHDQRQASEGHSYSISAFCRLVSWNQWRSAGPISAAHLLTVPCPPSSSSDDLFSSKCPVPSASHHRLLKLYRLPMVSLPLNGFVKDSQPSWSSHFGWPAA